MCTRYSNIYLLKKITMTKRDYIEYVDSWMSRKENVWRSFTYWSALYDWIQESRFDLDDLDIRYDIVQSIVAESGAREEWVDNLWDDVLVELTDISELDEYWRRIQEEINDEDIEDIFDDLDLITSFKTRDEFEEKVQELTEDKGNSELNWRTVAERYEDEHYLSIEEEED